MTAGWGWLGLAGDWLGLGGAKRLWRAFLEMGCGDKQLVWCWATVLHTACAMLCNMECAQVNRMLLHAAVWGRIGGA